MKNDILEQLKDLKRIAPDPDFAARTKRLILATSAPRRPFGIFAAWPKVALGAAVLAALVLVIEAPGAPKAVPIASAEALNNEFTNLSINIELKQVSYNQDVNQTIASAISEITTNKLSHLNPAVLQAESAGLNPGVPASDPKIDDLLNQVTN